jgi:thiamine pyrophosphokinase
VLTGGDPITEDLSDLLAARPLVIAADSGLDQAARLDITVDLAIGDFDSASPATVADAERAGTRVERHPHEKDRTDLELALAAAAAAGAREVTVVGGAGGRLDHLLGNLLAMTSADLEGITVDARVGTARVTAVAERTAQLRGKVGEIVSLFAVGGAARGVTTEGLQYALNDETLLPGSSRGVSNVHVLPDATVFVREGAVLAIHPGATEAHR